MPGILRRRLFATTAPRPRVGEDFSTTTPRTTRQGAYS